MDSITQATLGAAIGETLLGRKIGRKGAILGAIVATIPDLDVVLLPFLDPLERLSMHRGFSHSILFSIVFAAILVLIFRKWKYTNTLNTTRLFLFSWLTLITHMILDAFTPYGTLLLLPFSNRRIGFDSINIVDPFYTVPLLVGLGITLYYNQEGSLKNNANRLGLIISSLYLITTLVVKYNVNQKFQTTFTNQKITTSNILSEPVGIGSLHWYGLGRTTDGFYMTDYSYINPLPMDPIFFPYNDSLLSQIDTETRTIMKWFAKDFYHVAEKGDSLLFYNMQVDMQGIHKVQNKLAPTKGYFVIENKKNGKLIGSGRH